jgi:hypothetical protein
VEKNFFNEWDEDKMAVIKKAMYAVALFHGACFLRSLYGHTGWNRDYRFSNSDYEISKEVTRHLVLVSHEPPVQSLSKILTEIV